MPKKISIKTIQFKRGAIEKLPEEALYGEPILVYDKEGNYYLYIGLGPGKKPTLLSNKPLDDPIDEETISKLIEEKLTSLIKESEFDELETNSKKIIIAINEINRRLDNTTTVSYNSTTGNLTLTNMSYDSKTSNINIGKSLQED